MIKRSLLFVLALASSLTLPGLASANEATITDVASRYQRHQYYHRGITQDEAIDIAISNGIRYVDRIQIIGGNFKVIGRDRYYRSRTVTIDPYDGDVLDIGHVRGQY